MGARERADDVERSEEISGTRPDQSGTRRRPDDDFEVIDERELELVELVRHGRASTPPPVPPRTPSDDRIDLDALLRQMALSSTPRGAATRPGPLLVPPSPPPPRAQWNIALVVGTTAIVASSITAIALALTSSVVPGVHDAEQKHAAPKHVVVITAPSPAAREGRATLANAVANTAANTAPNAVDEGEDEDDRTAPPPASVAASRAAPAFESAAIERSRATRVEARARRRTASRPAPAGGAGASVQPTGAAGVEPETTEPPQAEGVELAAAEGAQPAEVHAAAEGVQPAGVHAAAEGVQPAEVHAAAADVPSAEVRAAAEDVQWAETRDSPAHLGELMDRATNDAEDRVLAGEEDRVHAGEIVEAAAPSTVPARPSRDDVENAMHAVMPALRACAPGMDLVTVELHFAPTGRATTARVDGRHLSPAQRSCIARAARAAKVPAFGGPRLSVRYPVRL